MGKPPCTGLTRRGLWIHSFSFEGREYTSKSWSVGCGGDLLLTHPRHYIVCGDEICFRGLFIGEVPESAELVEMPIDCAFCTQIHINMPEIPRRCSVHRSPIPSLCSPLLFHRKIAIHRRECAAALLMRQRWNRIYKKSSHRGTAVLWKLKDFPPSQQCVFTEIHSLIKKTFLACLLFEN